MKRVSGLIKSYPSTYIWRLYDESFRRLKQYSESLPWHVLNHHVLHEAREMAASPKVAVGHNSYSRGKGVPQKSAIVGLCYGFNKVTGCKRPNNCTFRHVCSKCEAQHPAFKCSKQAQGSRANNVSTK